MSNTVRAGYMGLADLGGTKVRCTSFSVNPNQDVLFYNHTIGLRDTVPTNNATKGAISESSTDVNIQRRIWRPSPISVAGGISFPATETSLVNVFNLAKYANYFDINFNYYCDTGSSSQSRIFTDCRINGFDMSVVAGDVVNINADVICKNVETDTYNVSYEVPEKLITWDQVPTKVTSAPFNVDDMLVQGFNFKINNNIQTIYTTNNTGSATPPTTTESLLPTDLRVGMQEVTGSITVYLDSGEEFIPIALPTYANITVAMPNLNLKMTVVFKSNQMEGQVGPIMTQLPFVGVDYSFT
jgi:hypothetical protein